MRVYQEGMWVGSMGILIFHILYNYRVVWRYESI